MHLLKKQLFFMKGEDCKYKQEAVIGIGLKQTVVQCSFCNI